MIHIEIGIKNMAQHLKDDSHLIKQLVEQSETNPKFIYKRMEELLHEGNLTISSNNHRALAGTDERFESNGN